MRVIKASTQIVLMADGMEILRNIERVGRICYKSEDKITEDSCNLLSRCYSNVVTKQ